MTLRAAFQETFYVREKRSRKYLPFILFSWIHDTMHDILKKDLWKGLRELFIISYKVTKLDFPPLNIINYWISHQLLTKIEISIIFIIHQSY